MIDKYKNFSREQLLEKLKQLEKHRYGLVWEDKLEAVAEQCEQQLPVLHEEISKEIISDVSKPINVIIEGDNYHALYTLNFTHKRKVDVIYIDPPYNTGNSKEWKYNDKYVDKNDTYRHSKWISFMSKRLKLAKNLLKDTGLIFISIDDNEVAQLKLLCNQIFGESNFIQDLIWHNKYTVSSDAKFFSKQHDYILCYSKNLNKASINLLKRTEKTDARYKNQDNDIRGPWKPTPLDARSGTNANIFEISFPNKITWKPTIGRYSVHNREKLLELYSDNRLWFGKSGKSIPSKKTFLSEVSSGIKCGSILDYQTFGHTHKANDELSEIIGKGKFTSPKPLDLLKQLILLGGTKDAIILDFFAGSGTTGHAVLQLNMQDDGNRQFILCTNNESNICEEVTYLRLKKVIKGYDGKKCIPANLKYYKTDFVPQVITDNDKRILVNRSTELLCIAENTFQLVIQEKQEYEFAIYKSNKQHTAIIYDEDSIERCKEELIKLKPKVKTVIYVFSYNHEYNTEEFEDLPFRFHVKPIPEAILNVYRKNAKLKRK